MIFIAHRGLFEGPDKEKENHPDQIEKALLSGFQAEVDVRYKDGKWFLGHDEPQYEVPLSFIANPLIWSHCKNLEAMMYCPNQNRFWHDRDAYTFTYSGFIWSYPGQPLLFKKQIAVMPEMFAPAGIMPYGTYGGICSDYVGQMR